MINCTIVRLRWMFFFFIHLEIGYYFALNMGFVSVLSFQALCVRFKVRSWSPCDVKQRCPHTELRIERVTPAGFGSYTMAPVTGVR
jgi:hypothetical protein